jgi:hypothetical protein
MRTTLMLLCLSASVALADETKPSLVTVPLDVDLDPGLQKIELKLRNAYFDTLDRKSGAALVLKGETNKALQETKRQDFRESDEGVGRLAEKAGALYGMYAFYEYTPKKVLILTGRVVRDDGKLMKTGQVQQPKGKESFEDVLRALTVKLCEQLGVSKLPTAKEVVVVPPPVETPPVEVKKDPPIDFVPPPPPPLVDPIVKDDGAGQRTAGKALFGTGIAVGVVGAIVAGVGAGIGYGVRHDDNNQVSANGAMSAATARSMNTAGIVGGCVGGVAAVVGAIVWGTAKPAPATISVAPVAGGAFVQVGASF